ncbi:MAG: VWA domain-containing protein [Proteobacteria bacterium]|nr:VWA domain-containing protein [Pseudomonadota bacterium]
MAELTFQDEQIIEAVPLGLVQPSCSTQKPADAVFRFSVQTSFDHALMPGVRYSALEDVLTPGKNFKANHVSFADGWFFVVDTASEDTSCESELDCIEGASCLTPDEMGLTQYYYPPRKYCVFPTTITVNSDPSFTHYQNNPLPGNALVSSLSNDGRSFAFVLDNSASLDGSQETGIPDAALSTDPWQYRKVGLNLFMDALDDSQRYEFSAHFANGIGANGVYDASESWMRTKAVWNSTVMESYPSPSGYSPIWEAASAALQKLIETGNAGYAKSLIVFTDGEPNENDTAYDNFKRYLAMASGIPIYWMELTSGQPTKAYGDAVAAGCGVHYLFDNPVFMSKMMQKIAINSESHWDVDLAFSAKLPSGHLYKLATTAVIQIGKTAVAFEAQRLNEETETIDYRLVLSK